MSKSSVFRGAATRDDNEPLFTELLDRYHIEYAKGTPGDGYDLCVHFPITMHLWEIKNPSQPRSKRKLTPAELHKQEYCKTFSIPYHVLEYTDQAVTLIAIALAYHRSQS